MLRLPVAGGAPWGSRSWTLPGSSTSRSSEDTMVSWHSRCLPSVPDGTHEAKGRHSISMTPGSISALASLRVEHPYLEMRPRSVQHDGNNARLPALAVDHLRLVCDD